MVPLCCAVLLPDGLLFRACTYRGVINKEIK